MDVGDASYYIQIMKIKVAKWGTPKKYLKKSPLYDNLTIQKEFIQWMFDKDCSMQCVGQNFKEGFRLGEEG